MSTRWSSPFDEAAQNCREDTAVIAAQDVAGLLERRLTGGAGPRALTQLPEVVLGRQLDLRSAAGRVSDGGLKRLADTRGDHQTHLRKLCSCRSLAGRPARCSTSPAILIILGRLLDD